MAGDSWEQRDANRLLKRHRVGGVECVQDREGGVVGGGGSRCRVRGPISSNPEPRTPNPLLRRADDTPQVRDACRYRAQGREVRVRFGGDDASECRFARSRWAPEDA